MYLRRYIIFLDLNIRCRYLLRINLPLFDLRYHFTYLFEKLSHRDHIETTAQLSAQLSYAFSGLRSYRTSFRSRSRHITEIDICPKLPDHGLLSNVCDNLSSSGKLRNKNNSQTYCGQDCGCCALV